MQKFLTIKNSASSELEIKKSRFIASFSRADTAEQAEEFIKSIKNKHKTANHNCSAYLIGEQNQIERARDDGEPAGTAGIPMLEALKLMKLQNTVVVVTRYFGGIKLGSGGLIRAYSNAVSNGAKEIGIVQISTESELIFTIPYDQLGKVEYYLNQHNLTLKNQEFGEAILLAIWVAPADLKKTMTELTDILKGHVDFTIGDPHLVESPIFS